MTVIFYNKSFPSLPSDFKFKRLTTNPEIFLISTGSSGEDVTSICIFRCVLKWESRVRKMDSESSKTSGTEETPFLDRATHRYCLIALMNISLVLKMGPAFCRMDSSSWRDKTLDRSS